MKYTKPFVYEIRSDALRGNVENQVFAWKSSAPGLILQVPPDSAIRKISDLRSLLQSEDLTVHITHQASSCILLTFVPYSTARWVCGALSGLPIKWNCKTAEEIYLQISKFDGTAQQLFFAVTGFMRRTSLREDAIEMARNHKKRTAEWSRSTKNEK